MTSSRKRPGRVPGEERTPEGGPAPEKLRAARASVVKMCIGSSAPPGRRLEQAGSAARPTPPAATGRCGDRARVERWRGGATRQTRGTLRFQHPPIEPCMRFSRTRLTDGLLSMVTPPPHDQGCLQPRGRHAARGSRTAPLDERGGLAVAHSRLRRCRTLTTGVDPPGWLDRAVSVMSFASLSPRRDRSRGPSLPPRLSQRSPVLRPRRTPASLRSTSPLAYTSGRADEAGKTGLSCSEPNRAYVPLPLPRKDQAEAYPERQFA